MNALLAIHKAQSEGKMLDHQFEVDSFLLKFGEAAKAAKKEGGKSWQEMRQLAQMFSVAMNAEESRKKKKR